MARVLSRGVRKIYRCERYELLVSPGGAWSLFPNAICTVRVLARRGLSLLNRPIGFSIVNILNIINVLQYGDYFFLTSEFGRTCSPGLAICHKSLRNLGILSIFKLSRRRLMAGAAVPRLVQTPNLRPRDTGHLDFRHSLAI